MTRPPLLMIAGHLCDARIYAELIPQLVDAAEASVVAPPIAPEIDAMAEKLLAEAPERFAVAGFSLGGMIATAMMAQAPERLLGAALLATDPHAAREKENVYRRALLEAVGRSNAGAYVDQLVANFFPHKTSAAAALGPDLRRMAMEAAATRLEAEAEALMTRRDRVVDLAGFERPVAVIVGALDRLCPPILSETIAEACPDPTLIEIAGVGHMAPLEAPNAVGAALTSWLTRFADARPA